MELKCTGKIERGTRLCLGEPVMQTLQNTGRLAHM